MLSNLTMRDSDKYIQEQCRLKYEPLCRSFFEKLKRLDLSDNSLKAIPELFVPSCGEYYADSLVKIAIMGKETYGWGTSLYDILQDFEKGESIAPRSGRYFRDEGPAIWQNNFWKYFAEVLALMYDLDADRVLSQDSPVLESIAWNNCHAIETYQSDGIDRGAITEEEMRSVQEIAFEAGITHIDHFIDVFKPQVILHLYRNQDLPDSYRAVENAEFVKGWGKEGFLHEYSYKGVVILHCWHSSYMTRGKVSKKEFAEAVCDALASHKLFKRFRHLPHYDETTDYSHFCELANQMAADGNPSSLQDFQDLAQEIITGIALELRKMGATMTARLLTATILNQVPCFKAANWQYSPNGRGPCRVVTGVWNALANQGKYEEAAHVAHAYTGIHGDICWN